MTKLEEWWDNKPSECLIGRDTARWIWNVLPNAIAQGREPQAKRPTGAEG